MLLERHIGNRIEVALKSKDRWTKLFTNFIDPDITLPLTLVAIDNIGIWVREYAKTVIIRNTEGNEIPKEEWKAKKTVISVLIKWEDIETIIAYVDPLLNDQKIEFCLLEQEEVVEDLY